TVFAITGEHVVVLPDCGDRADTNCFLADVKMTEAANLAGDVNFRGFLLEAPDQKHLAVKLDESIVVEPAETTLLTVLRFVSFLGKQLWVYVWRCCCLFAHEVSDYKGKAV